MHWRRQWQPTPVFLPGESHGWRSLVGYSPQGLKESDMTERLHYVCHWAILYLVAQRVKNPPAMQDTWVQSLDPDNPLEKGMTTHSSILAWRIPGMGEPGGLLSVGLHRVGHD